MSTVRPYLKAFAIVPEKYNNQVCSTGFAVMSCKKDLTPLFLLYILLSDIVINQCTVMMVGGQYPALNTKQVESIIIPVPSTNEQNKIAQILTAIDDTIEIKKKKKEKLERIKKKVMTLLLTGQVRIVLDD